MRLTFENATEKYKASIMRRGFAVQTIINKEAYFIVFGSWLSQRYPECFQDLRAVTCDIINGFVDSLFLKALQPSTIQIYLSNLKVFFSYLYKNDFLSADPTRKIDNIRVPKKEIVYNLHETIMKVLNEMFLNFYKGQNYDLTLRNYFIIRCAYTTGWRSSEARNCLVENINWETGEIKIIRKGGKDGYVYLDLETAKRMKEWYFSKYPNGKYLFYSSEGKKIGYTGYNRVFLKYFGLPSHRMRASFATYMISNDVGIKDVADLMGHESLSSTMRYAARVKSRIIGIHRAKNPFS